MPTNLSPILFQFHKGTIKTHLNTEKNVFVHNGISSAKIQKILLNKCRCLMIIFLRPYDNLPIYGGFNKSKSTFGVFVGSKSCN